MDMVWISSLISGMDGDWSSHCYLLFQHLHYRIFTNLIFLQVILTRVVQKSSSPQSRFNPQHVTSTRPSPHTFLPLFFTLIYWLTFAQNCNYIRLKTLGKSCIYTCRSRFTFPSKNLISILDYVFTCALGLIMRPFSQVTGAYDVLLHLFEIRTIQISYLRVFTALVDTRHMVIVCNETFQHFPARHHLRSLSEMF